LPDLWRLLDQRFETFQQVYDERLAAKYGFCRPIVERSVKSFLKCGDLHQGFARVRCPDCQGPVSRHRRSTWRQFAVVVADGTRRWEIGALFGRRQRESDKDI